MPERQWRQIVRDTAEKRRREAFGRIPDYVLSSPWFVSWKKKYTPEQIMQKLAENNFSWEREEQKIAISDPGERLGPGFNDVLTVGSTDATN